MTLALDQKNAALDTVSEITELSLHSHYSAVGDNELPPIGDPGLEYARVPVAFTPASNAVKFSTDIRLFNVPAGYQVAWIGLWTFDGQFRGMIPNGGESPSNPLLPFAVMPGDMATGLITDTSQNIGTGYVGSQLWFWDGGVGTSTLPNGLQFNGPWTVLDTDGAYGFTVSLIGVGADPQLFSSWGWGFWQRIVVQPFLSQGVFQLNSLVFSAYG